MTPRKPKSPKTYFFTKSLPNRSEKQIQPKFVYRTAARSKIHSKRDSRPCFVEKTTLRRATFATEHGKYAEFDFCAYFSCSVVKVNPKVRHESANSGRGGAENAMDTQEYSELTKIEKITKMRTSPNTEKKSLLPEIGSKTQSAR